MGLPRHLRVPSPQTPGAHGLPKARRATRKERDEGLPSGGFLRRSHKPTFSRLRAQCLPGLGEQQRPRGMGWEGRTAWDEGRVPRDTCHPDARAHAGWGLYRAGGGQTRGSWGHRGTGGPCPDPVSAEARLPRPLRVGYGWQCWLGARVTPEPPGARRGHAWSPENGHWGCHPPWG